MLCPRWMDRSYPLSGTTPSSCLLLPILFLAAFVAPGATRRTEAWEEPVPTRQWEVARSRPDAARGRDRDASELERAHAMLHTLFEEVQSVGMGWKQAAGSSLSGVARPSVWVHRESPRLRLVASAVNVRRDGPPSSSGGSAAAAAAAADRKPMPGPLSAALMGAAGGGSAGTMGTAGARADAPGFDHRRDGVRRAMRRMLSRSATVTEDFFGDPARTN